MGELFYTLVLLACPVGMGLMMWFMMRGNKSADHDSGTASPTESELAALRQELDELRAVQRDRPSVPDEPGDSPR